MIVQIPVEYLLDHPDNPRGIVNQDAEDIKSLAASIKEQGVIEPLIVVQAADGRFFVIAGHRRKTASIIAGLTTVPCIIRNFKNRAEEIEVMLVENLQREGLSPLQEASAYKQMLELGHTMKSISIRCGVSIHTIRERLNLLSLDAEVQTLVEAGKIGLGQALILLSVQDVGKQRELAIRAQRMTTTGLSRIVRDLLNGASARRASTSVGNPRGRPVVVRVLDENEKFTRSWALKRLLEQNGRSFTLVQLAESFDDVCQDACVEGNSEELCKECPVPRLIESLLRRAVK